MRGPGVHKPGSTNYAGGGAARQAASGDTEARPLPRSIIKTLGTAAQQPLEDTSAPPHRGAPLLFADSSFFCFKKVWTAQENNCPPAAAHAAEKAASTAEGRSSSAGFVSGLCTTDLSPYSSAFSRLTASLSKTTPPATSTKVEEDDSGLQALLKGLATGKGGEEPAEGLSASFAPEKAAFHYAGTPSSGRLVPLGRLNAHDPTLEGRIEAFIAECCDAGGAGCDAGDKGDRPATFSREGSQQTSAVISGDSGIEDDTAARLRDEEHHAKIPGYTQQRQQLRMTATVGALTGKYTRWKICLPVALPAMLEEQSEANVKFEEALSEEHASVAGTSGSYDDDEGPATRKGGEKDSQQQSPLLQQLLQRLLEARRQAYELLPAKKVYELVERRGTRATAGGEQQKQHFLQTAVEEQDEEEAGLGGARVLRYRLFDAPSSSVQPVRIGRTASSGTAGHALSNDASGGHGENQLAQHAAVSKRQTIYQKEPAAEGAATAGNASTAGKGDGDVAADAALKIPNEGKHTERDRTRREAERGSSNRKHDQDCSIQFSGRYNRQEHQERPLVEIVERIPLGCRFIYRPKSDRHIRLAAESEIVSLVGLPASLPGNLQEDGQRTEQQTAQGWEENKQVTRERLFMHQLQNEDKDVKQRWWAVHDVWELQPRRSKQGCESSKHQTLQRGGPQQKEYDEGNRAASTTEPKGPRWSVVITEEGEIEDCNTDAVTLLLRRLASGNNKTASDLLKRYASGGSGGTRAAEGAETSLATPEGMYGSPADDVDRYEETKRTSLQLVGCGLELQHQRARQQQLQKNVFGALALLLVENAQVLARWFDESFERAGARPTSVAATGALYYPNHLGDAVQAVQRHYNQRKLISAGRSRVTGLRLHNNQVKRMMVNKYVERGQSVLELACGHGQDLWKYADRCISKFVGVDISLGEIREARRRVREGDRAAQHMLQQMLRPPVFHVGNLVDSRALNFLKAELFDIVSIQLSIHYMVETEKQARGVLARAAAHLKDGGLLIGSTVCCDAIASRLLQLRPLSPVAAMRGERRAAAVSTSFDHQGPGSAGAIERRGTVTEDGYEFGNDLYSVSFTRASLQKLLGDYQDPSIVADVIKRLAPKQDADAGADLDGESPTGDESGALFASVTSPAAQAALVEYFRDRLAREFGVSYHFYLADSIDAKEFVLPWRSMCAIAASVGLKLVSSMTFPEFLEAAAADPRCGRDLTKWLAALTPSKHLDKPQFEAFSLYKIFVFKKITQTRGSLHSQGERNNKLLSSDVRMPAEAGKSSERAGNVAAADGLDTATIKDNHKLILNGINSIVQDRSNSTGTCESTTEASTGNRKDGPICALELACSGPAQVPVKSEEGQAVTLGAVTVPFEGERAPITNDEETRKRVSRQLVEGVPLKRRQKTTSASTQ